MTEAYLLPTSVKSLTETIEKSFLDVLTPLGIKQLPPRVIGPSKSAGFSKALTCYQIAKPLKINAEEVAEKATTALLANKNPLFSQVKQEKAQVLFNVSTQALASAGIGEYMVLNLHSVREDPPCGHPVVIEFSSPNTNKPQHLGHVRNNCIGNAIANMILHSGQRVVKINLVNDRGVHICKSMLAYKKFGKGETPESIGKKGDHLVGDYYVKFETEFEIEYKAWLETDKGKEEHTKWKTSDSAKKALSANEKERKKIEALPESEEKKKQLVKLPDEFGVFKSDYKQFYLNNFSTLGKEANDMLVAWESGDAEVRKLWELMNSWVFSGFDVTYKRFGIKHDVTERESQIYEKGKEIVLDSLNKGQLEKLENGSIACDLVKIGVLKKGTGEKNTKKVLLRANGTSIYMTQDLGVALNRCKIYNPQKVIYVVASEQDRHFEILFKLVESLQPDSKGKWHHLSYGMVNLPEGRMKSREGTVVDADKLADKLLKKSLKITTQKWPELTPDEASFRAEKIAMAALKFYILAFNPPTTITFDPKKSLDFHGKSGPYLLYQYARTRSIIRKANLTPEDLVYKQDCLAKLGTNEELSVLSSLVNLNNVINWGVEAYDPSKVVDGIYDLSKELSSFYRDKEKHQVVHCSDPDLRYARLLLVYAVGEAMKRGLTLLGIETLEKM